MAHKHALAMSKLIAAAAVEVANQAERSVAFSAQINKYVTEFTKTEAAAIGEIQRGRSPEPRSMRLCARHAQYIADKAEEVSEAAREVHLARAEFFGLLVEERPRVRDLRRPLTDAMKAAVRAERAARTARGCAWKSVELILDSADLQDDVELVAPQARQ